jgi:hypothetical protein
MSRYTPTPTKAKAHIDPLAKIFVWRCSDCKYVNETLGSEKGSVRMLTGGDELREPMWYEEKCEMCRQKAGRGCCLLQTKPITPFQPMGEAKGKIKAPVDEDA